MKKIIPLWLQVILEISLLIGGFWILTATMFNWIDFGASDFAVWNRRILIFTSIAMIALGTAISYPTSKAKNPAIKIWVFALTFIVLSTVMFAIGGLAGYFSVLESGATDETLDARSIWIAYDLSDIGLGINIRLITDSVAYAFPVVVIALTIVQLYYAGEADEYLKAVLEGVVGMGFLIVYAMWIVPAFR